MLKAQLTPTQKQNRVKKRILTTATLTPPGIAPSTSKTTKRKPLKPKLKLPPSSLASQFRHLKPNWRAYIEYAMLAAKDGDKDMEQYVATYQVLSKKELLTHTPEAVCELANIKPSELFGSVCRKLWECSSNEASMITAINHPIIIEKTAKYAAQKQGVKDREMFHKATGFLPTPKGNNIHINNSPQTLIAGGGIRPALPSVKDDMEELDGLSFLPALEAGDGVDSTQDGEEDIPDGD